MTRTFHWRFWRPVKLFGMRHLWRWSWHRRRYFGWVYEVGLGRDPSSVAYYAQLQCSKPGHNMVIRNFK